MCLLLCLGDTNDLKKQDVKKNVPANEEDEKKWSYVENNYESIEINGQEVRMLNKISIVLCTL